jgi:hypothetical protein
MGADGRLLADLVLAFSTRFHVHLPDKGPGIVAHNN